MEHLSEGKRSEDAASIALKIPNHIPQLNLSSLHDNKTSNFEISQSARTFATGKTLSVLPAVHAKTTRNSQKETLGKSQATKSRYTQVRLKSDVAVTRFRLDHSWLSDSMKPDLHQKKLYTAQCFEALTKWQQTMKNEFHKAVLVSILDVLHTAIYSSPSLEMSGDLRSLTLSSLSDSPVENQIPLSETGMVEYFSLVADMQEKLKLQRQERLRLTTQLAMEKSLEQDLSAQLQLLEHDLAQSNLRRAYARAESEGEQRIVQNLEHDYSLLTEQEQNYQSDCEKLELQLANQQVQLKEARNRQLYLDFMSTAPLKRHMEEKKWQEQYMRLTLQLQNAERENRSLEDKICKLKKETLDLETQYARDVEAHEKAKVELNEVCANHEQLNEAYERTRACYTPRPDWDRIVAETPELLVYKPPWEMVESKTMQDMTDSSNRDSDIVETGVLERTDKEELSDNKNTSGQTKNLVKEMLHWIERLQKHCGANLYLSRMWHDVEEARVELNILHHQLDRVARRKSILSLLNVLDADSIAIAASGSPSKKKQEYILALGMHEGVPHFLRHCGKLKRKVLRKIDVDKVVRKVWVEKRKREQRNPLKRLPLEEILYEKLYRKYGFQPLIAEWGYNILLALQTFSWDSEIELFLLCLTGAVSDLVYIDQEQMILKCRQLLLRLCELYNVGSFVGERRLLLKDALVALRTFFPLKTSTQLQAIEKSIIRDMHKMKRGGNDSILYIDDVIPMNDKYPLGFFVKTIRAQHFKEIQDYYALLLSELEQRDTEHKGILTIATIQTTILTMDPLADPGKIHHMIKKALDIKTQGQAHIHEPVIYKAVLRKLNATCLMKFTLNYDQNAEVNWHRRPGTVCAVSSTDNTTVMKITDSSQ
ncbi:hypothetical protein Plhal304r1_c035g0107891 [Plasmopara halstedii]